MKATGVIRRIDELGRIVIPKEIRRNLKIRDGESLEIFIEDHSIILKKFSLMEDSLNFANNIVMLLASLTGCKVLVTDREHIISQSDNIAENIKKEILTNNILEIIEERKIRVSETNENFVIAENIVLSGYNIMYPIISNGDSIGLIILISDKKPEKSNLLLAKFASLLISNQITLE